MSDVVADARRLVRADLSAVELPEAPESAEEVAARLGVARERIVRLHLNENPYGPPLRVQEALASFDRYQEYPDPENRDIRRLLASYTGFDAGRIVVGNGSRAILDALLALFSGHGDAVIIPTPTISAYAERARAYGAAVRAVPRRADFSLDADALEAALDPAVKIVFVASPNDPTGNLCRERDIVRLLRHPAIVVVDEAYFEFNGRTIAPLIGEFDNLVVLRTLSHWAGIAGLRVAYALTPRWLAAELRKVAPPYGVNVAAQVAVPAVFDEMAYYRTTIRRIRLERLRMYRALRKLNFLKPLESKGNFLLAQMLHGTGAAVHTWLAEDGIFVRHDAGGELADYLRISVGRPEDTDRLMRRLTALAQRYAREIP